MKKYLMLFALLIVSVFAFNGVAYGWGSTGGDGSDYGQLQETAVFFNNSGGKLVHGMAVVLDLDSTASSTAPVKIAPTAGTTLGSCVETTTDADNVLVVGVVKVASENQTPVVVVTKGVIDTLANDSSDAVTTATAVGTTTASGGSIGGGTNLGIALEAGAGTDADYLMVWVDPTGAD